MKKWIVAIAILASVTSFAETRVLLFAGSARKDSYNKKLIKEAAAIAYEKGATVTVIDLKDYPIPIYNGDLEEKEGMPENAKKIRSLMIDNDVIMIASPEYNSSVTPLLLNVIDWASRDEKGGPSRAAYNGKTYILMSASPGQGGGSRGLIHLRQILNATGATVESSQVTIPSAHEAFDQNGKLKDSKKVAELTGLIEENLKQKQCS